jgi:hypothetical protein
MTDIRNLISEISEIVRRCPTPTLERAYRTAARDFCSQTRWLQVTSTLVATVADDDSYALTVADATTEVIALIDDVRAFEAGAPTQFWRLKPIDRRDAGTSTGQPSRYAYVPDATLMLFPTPDTVYGLRATVAVQPVLDATVIDDSLVRTWGTTLQQGALAHLYSIGKQSWSNPILAEAARKRFQSGINNAKADVHRGFNTGPIRVRPRSIGF